MTTRPDRKSLLILSLDTHVARFLTDIVQEIIGDEVNVRAAVLSEPASPPAHPDVVLTSGRHLADEARRRFPSSRVVVARRVIAGANLEQVLMLPEGTRVLVVNNPRTATEGTIASLEALGITHLAYIPYWNGHPMDAADIRIAITPGMGHLRPPGIERVIDIGPRLIGIGSFRELLAALDLDMGYLERYATRYHHLLVDASRRMAEVLARSEALLRRGELILNEFDEGVLAVDPEDRVELANAAAGRLLGEAAAALVGRSFAEVTSRCEKLADLAENAGPGGRGEGIYHLDGRRLVVNRLPVTGGSGGHLYVLREIARIQRLEKDVRLKLSRKGHVTKYGFRDIRGRSPAIRDLIQKARRFAATDKTILVTGETGTGKELLAHAIHRHGPRSGGPFVAINFAGLPESLIESELFGYEEGAFTGARRGGKPGVFEQAHGGTLFLDEIGDAPLMVQARLLRVIQEREVMKVGGSGIVPVDVRLVAATNADLSSALAAGRFRADLFHRLNVLPLEVPPLRDRPEDIPVIFHAHIEMTYRIRKRLTVRAEARLLAHSWPGNARELINCAEYACHASEDGELIDLEHLPRPLREAMDGDAATATPRASTPAEPDRSIAPPLAEDFRDIDPRLAAAGLEPARAALVLSAMREHAGRASRRFLAGLPPLREAGVTEGRLKRWMPVLTRLGLVSTGVTRQGSVLTPLGDAYLLRADWDDLGI